MSDNKDNKSSFFSSIGKAVVGGWMLGKWLAGKPSSEKMITKVCRNCGYGDTRLGKAWSSRNICPNCRKTGYLRIVR